MSGIKIESPHGLHRKTNTFLSLRQKKIKPIHLSRRRSDAENAERIKKLTDY
jgi:hypothetical protein